MTNNFAKILVTTDLSEESTKAYAMARGLAEKYGASVKLLSVVDTSIQFGYGGIFEMPMVYVPEALTEISRRVAKEMKEHLERYFVGANASFEVRESTGPVHHTISTYIQSEKADLVVMATHGRSGLRRMVIGSVAEQVVRSSSVPVLLVPTNPTTESTPRA